MAKDAAKTAVVDALKTALGIETTVETTGDTIEMGSVRKTPVTDLGLSEGDLTDNNVTDEAIIATLKTKVESWFTPPTGWAIDTTTGVQITLQRTATEQAANQASLNALAANEAGFEYSIPLTNGAETSPETFTVTGAVLFAEETPAETPLTYKFSEIITTLKGSRTDDLQVILPLGSVYTSPYFSFVGDNNKGIQLRPKYSCVELGAASNNNGLQFTTTSTSTVKVTFNSTGSSNYSIAALKDTSGELQLINAVSENADLTLLATGDCSGSAATAGTDAKYALIKGTTAATLTYNDLPAGTYIVHSPTATKSDTIDPTGRGFRCSEVEVTESNATAKEALTVAAPTAIELSKTSTSLANVDDTETLTATLTAADAYAAIIWASDDATIAKVDSYGKVTAVANGTTNITATSLLDSAVTATCAVTVGAQADANVTGNVGKAYVGVYDGSVDEAGTLAPSYAVTTVTDPAPAEKTTNVAVSATKLVKHAQNTDAATEGYWLGFAIENAKYGEGSKYKFKGGTTDQNTVLWDQATDRVITIDGVTYNTVYFDLGSTADVAAGTKANTYTGVLQQCENTEEAKVLWTYNVTFTVPLSYKITANEVVSGGSYTVKVDNAEVTNTPAGDTVAITPTPTDDTYVVDTVTVTKSDNSTVAVTAPTGSGTDYTFTMPADNVTISVTFKAKPTVTNVAFAEADKTKTATYGDANFTVTPTVTMSDASTYTGAIAYTSSTESVATVNATTGEVTVVAKGTTTITATVGSGADAKSDSYTLTVNNKQMTVSADNVTVTYDGQPHKITVTATDNTSSEAVAGATVTYCTEENGTYTADEITVTDAADTATTVYYKVNATGYDEKSGSATITVNKAPLTVTVTAPESLTYDGQPKALTVEVKSGETPISDATLTYSTDGTTFGELPEIKNAGSYTIYVKATKANYTDATSAACTFTITKATPTLTIGGVSSTIAAAGGEVAATVTTTPSDLTGYTVTCSNGTDTVSRKADEAGATWTFTIPENQATSAVTWTITATYTATDNYEAATDSATITQSAANTVAVHVTSPAQDAREVTVASGGNLELSVSATAEPSTKTLTFAWSYKASAEAAATSITEGVDSTTTVGTSTYTLSDVKRADNAGIYICEVSISDQPEVKETVEFTVTVNKKAATADAAGLTANDIATEGGTGGISGLNAANSYEYAQKPESGEPDVWTAVATDSTEIASLAAGTYLVRVAGDDETEPSAATEYTIAAWVNPNRTITFTVAAGASVTDVTVDSSEVTLTENAASVDKTKALTFKVSVTDTTKELDTVKLGEATTLTPTEDVYTVEASDADQTVTITLKDKPAETIYVTAVEVKDSDNGTNKEVTLGDAEQTVTLTATTTPASPTTPGVTWAITTSPESATGVSLTGESDTGVTVTVAANATVGTYVITATAKSAKSADDATNATATYTLTVKAGGTVTPTAKPIIHVFDEKLDTALTSADKTGVEYTTGGISASTKITVTLDSSGPASYGTSSASACSIKGSETGGKVVKLNGSNTITTPGVTITAPGDGKLTLVLGSAAGTNVPAVPVSVGGVAITGSPFAATDGVCPVTFDVESAKVYQIGDGSKQNILIHAIVWTPTGYTPCAHATTTKIATVAPTCTEGGYDTNYCSEITCFEIIRTNETEATGHSFSETTGLCETCYEANLDFFKAALNTATVEDATSATVYDETTAAAAAKTWAEGVVTAASGKVDVTITEVAFTAAVDGTEADADGTAGSYQFTVKLTRKSDSTEATSDTKTMNITAATYGAAADTTALTKAIAAAKTALAAVQESTDGTDVLIGTKWASATDRTTYQNAITAAETVAAKEGVTQAEVNQAVTDLATATTTFEAAQQDGTMAFVPPVDEGDATKGKYVLDFNGIETGTHTGTSPKAGTSNYFTIYYSKDSGKGIVEDLATPDEYDDGYTAYRRLSMGGASNKGADDRVIAFTTTNATATVEVWWATGGTAGNNENRRVAVLGSDGKTSISTTYEAPEAVNGSTTQYWKSPAITTPGKYYVGSLGNTCYIYKIRVIDTAGGSTEPTTKTITFTIGEGATVTVGQTELTSASADKTVTVDADATVTFTVAVDSTHTLGTVTGATESGGTYTVTGTAVEVPTTATSQPATEYTITKAEATNGSFTVSAEKAAAGTEITVTPAPASGYELDAITVKDADNGDVTVTDGKFTMPAKNVTVTVTFKAEGTTPVTKTIAFTVANVEKTYDGTAYGVTVNVTDPAAGATVLYASSQDGEYTATPITRTDVGVSTVWVKVTATGYEDSEAKSATVTVTQAAVTLTLTAAPNDIHAASAGAATEVTLTVSGQPDGAEVTITCDDTSIVVTGGKATLPDATKTYTFTATYAGDANHAGDTATATVDVTAYGEVNKNALKAAIREAQAKLEDVEAAEKAEDVAVGQKWATQADIDKLTKAIEDAQAEVDSTASTDESVAAAKTALETAANAFTAQEGTKTADTKALTDAIDAAQKALDAATVAENGSGVSKSATWITEADKAALQAKIDAATKLAANETASQDAINAAAQELSDLVDDVIKAGTKSSGGGYNPGSSSSSSSSSTPSTGSTTTKTQADGSTVKTTTAADGSVTTTVTLGKGVETTTVSVPVADADNGLVAVIVKDDGTEEIIRDTAVVNGEVIFDLDENATVKIVNNAKTFVDIPGHWAEDDVNFVSARELFNGVDATHFSPDTAMTRGMLATVLYRLDGEAKADKSVDFSDVAAGDWYADAVDWAAEREVINGYEDGSFGPNRSITRQELVVMIYRYAGSPEAGAADMTGFNDVDAIADWAADAMRWAIQTGLIKGRGDGKLDPQGNATRAEVSAVLARYVSLGK